MISLEINIDELRKRNFEEVAEITEQYLDEVEKFENVTKGELIRIMADKLDEAGYPIKEIREKIDERLKGKVTRQYISQQLDDRFKNPKRVAAGRAIREAEKQLQQTNVGSSGLSTVMAEPEFDEETEADVEDSKYLAQKNWESPFGTDDETKLTVIKIEKMDANMLMRLTSATTWSKNNVYLLIHPKTGRVEQIYSDVFYEKRFKQNRES